jgi:hypothetical protein
MSHLLKSAIAAACTAFLAACGGSGSPGEGLQGSAQQSTANPEDGAPDDGGRSFSDMTQALRAEARERGITKTIYSLGGQIGAYGQTLVDDGWTVVDASPADVPTAAQTIVYVNAADEASQRDSVVQFLAGFSGVLVIDSDQRQALLPDEDTVADRVTAMSLPEESAAEAGPAPAYYLRVSGGEAKYAPSATALITSSTSNSITPVLVHEDGGINGSSVAGREDLIDLTIVALDSLKKAEASAATVRPMGFSSTRTNWDRVVDLNYTADNWNVIGGPSSKASRRAPAAGTSWRSRSTRATTSRSAMCLARSAGSIRSRGAPSSRRSARRRVGGRRSATPPSSPHARPSTRPSR